MHDYVWFEKNGKPAITIATEPFADGAAAQASALGMPDLECVYVTHPIQDAEDDEIRRKADAIVNQLLAALTGMKTTPV